MIQIAYFSTQPPFIGTELKAEFILIEDEESAAFHRGPLILGLNEVNFEALKRIVTIRDHQVIIAISNKQNFKYIPELKFYLPKIFGFIDLTAEKEMSVPMIRNYINLNF